MEFGLAYLYLTGDYQGFAIAAICGVTLSTLLGVYLWTKRDPDSGGE